MTPNGPSRVHTAAKHLLTAHWLLIIDELQDASASHLEAVFQPMRAAGNATALYIGTVKTTTDALWLKKQELEERQQRDGIQRVFIVSLDQVTAAHGAGEYARDDDGDGIREVHCNTTEGMGTDVRTFLRQFKGVHKKYLAGYVAICEFRRNLKRVSPSFISPFVAFHSFHC